MSTRWKAFDTIWGKLRERKVASATQERVVYIVLGYFFQCILTLERTVQSDA